MVKTKKKNIDLSVERLELFGLSKETKDKPVISSNKGLITFKFTTNPID